MKKRKKIYSCNLFICSVSHSATLLLVSASYHPVFTLYINITNSRPYLCRVIQHTTVCQHSISPLTIFTEYEDKDFSYLNTWKMGGRGGATYNHTHKLNVFCVGKLLKTKEWKWRLSYIQGNLMFGYIWYMTLLEFCDRQNRTVSHLTVDVHKLSDIEALQKCPLWMKTTAQK